MGPLPSARSKTIPVILFVLLIITGIFICMTYYVAARNYVKFNGQAPVVKEISADTYEDAIFAGIARARTTKTQSDDDTIIEKSIHMEEIKALLTDSRYCPIQICKPAESKYIPMTYCADAIAKKDGDTYFILDDTVINQYFQTPEGVAYEPELTKHRLSDNGRLKTVSQGKLTVSKQFYNSLKSDVQKDYTYCKDTDNYVRTICAEWII